MQRLTHPSRLATLKSVRTLFSDDSFVGRVSGLLNRMGSHYQNPAGFFGATDGVLTRPQ